MTVQEISTVYKALSVPSRIEILKLLGRGTYCVNAITRFLDISQPAVSQHLTVLRQCGLVVGKKEGYMVHYSLTKERLKEFNLSVAQELGEEFVMFKKKSS